MRPWAKSPGVIADTATVACGEFPNLSLTTSPTEYDPVTSGVSVAYPSLGVASWAALPLGLTRSDQAYDSGSPFGSMLAVPSSVTWDPTMLDTAGPGFAAGATHVDETVTCDGALDQPVLGSVTTSCNTKVPGASSKKLGVAMLAPVNTAALALGRDIRVHAY